MKSQKKIWTEEHLFQRTFTRIHSKKPSKPLPEFVKYLKKQEHLPKQINILDLGCGKGRNSLWLASQGFGVIGVDFVPEAVVEATSRTRKRFKNLKFKALDLTKKLPFKNSNFHAIIDCNTTICISLLGRKNTIAESLRVLKPGGLYLFYGVSRTPFVNKNPGPEPNSTIFSKSGKFEKQYTRKELLNSYQDFKLIKLEKQKGSDIIEGENITYSMWIGIFQKPIK